jgi:hypothetical protein
MNRYVLWAAWSCVLALSACDDSSAGSSTSDVGLITRSDAQISLDMLPPITQLDGMTLRPTDAQQADNDANSTESDGMICGTLSVSAQEATRPVDIVWAIDSSPSMRNEIDAVTTNLNAFAARLGGSALDYHVVMIGSDRDLEGGVDIPELHDHIAICVPPPLSAVAGCPDTDSDRYLHVRQPIHSADALDVSIRNFATWQGFLRPEARLHMIIVSDDDHRASVMFDTLMAMGLPADMYVHSIVNPLDYVDGCVVFGEPDGIECGCGDDRGRTYIAMSEQTHGLVLNLCQGDWSPIFDELTERVETGSQIPCAFRIPEAPGVIIDYQRVNVDFVQPDGTRIPLFNVDDCATDPRGWYYDNPVMPTQILLCPEACGDIEGDVEIELGCEIRKRV